MNEAQMWLDNQKLLKKMTVYLYYKWQDYMDKSDIEDEVSFALFKAIRSFDPKKNVKFSTWAIRLMKQHVKRLVDHIIKDMERSYEHQDLGSKAWKYPETLHAMYKAKSKPRINEAKRKRAATKKAEWLKGKMCQKCNRKKNLMIVHPTIKRFGSLWSVCQAKRDRHLSESMVLCRPCTMDRRFPDRHKHGTHSMYLHHGCRCSKCKEAYKNGRKK